MSRTKKPEPEVSAIVGLLDTQTIEGYEIKEWSIRQFALLYPYLKTVFRSLQAQGVTLDNAQEYLKDNFMGLIDAFVPVLPEILELSLNLTPEQVDQIPAAKASILGLAILKKNTEHVTSFLAQIKGSLRE